MAAGAIGAAASPTAPTRGMSGKVGTAFSGDPTTSAGAPAPGDVPISCRVLAGGGRFASPRLPEGGTGRTKSGMAAGAAGPGSVVAAMAGDTGVGDGCRCQFGASGAGTSESGLDGCEPVSNPEGAGARSWVGPGSGQEATGRGSEPPPASCPWSPEGTVRRAARVRTVPGHDCGPRVGIGRLQDRTGPVSTFVGLAHWLIIGDPARRMQAPCQVDVESFAAGPAVRGNDARSDKLPGPPLRAIPGHHPGPPRESGPGPNGCAAGFTWNARLPGRPGGSSTKRAGGGPEPHPSGEPLRAGRGLHQDLVGRRATDPRPISSPRAARPASSHRPGRPPGGSATTRSPPVRRKGAPHSAVAAGGPKLRATTRSNPPRSRPRPATSARLAHLDPIGQRQTLDGRPQELGPGLAPVEQDPAGLRSHQRQRQSGDAAAAAQVEGPRRRLRQVGDRGPGPGRCGAVSVRVRETRGAGRRPAPRPGPAGPLGRSGLFCR